MSTSKPGSRNKVVSCAECRRLKLRCDRQFPCHNCTKRGLRAICPDGALPTRPKVLLEETERLNRQNSELLERIRLLEDGLASIQAGISDDPHPLLSKTTLDAEDHPTGSTKREGDVDEIDDSLGTLTIDAEGRSFFLGQSAGIESLFRNELRHSAKLEKPVSQSPSVLHSLGIFSSLHESAKIVMDVLRDYLPSPQVASSLTQTYFDYGSWLYNPIPKHLFLSQVYNPVYGVNSEQGSLANVSSHNAALLFMVFALGSFFDPSRPSDSDDAEKYHQLSRTAMSCDAILVEPTMPAIRTLLLMAFYHLVRDTNGPQHCWALLGLASHLAENIGLHRDSLRWKLDEALVQERRALFWELYCFAINQSLNFGRPPSLLLAFCDCEQPQNLERLENRQGEIKPSFNSRKYQFAAECVSQVVEAVLSIKHTPYSTILALDRKIRDCQALKVPPNGAYGPAEIGAATEALTLQRFMLKATCEMGLMYLHRQYFARAIRDHPEDPLGCRYGPSTLATYRSACVYASLMRSLCSLHPQITSRYFLFWNHLLAASIVVGSVATKCPKSVLAPSAIFELDGCFTLFEKAASFGDSRARPARALTIVSRLRDRAHQLAAAVQAGFVPEPSQGLNDSTSEQTDELSILSGRGRLVSTNNEPSPNASQDSTSISSPPLPFGGTVKQSTTPLNFDSYSTAHPYLLDSLRDATKQYSSADYPSTMPYTDMSMWDSSVVQDGQNPASVSPPPLNQWNSNTATTMSEYHTSHSTPVSAATSSPSPPIIFAPGQSNYPPSGTILNPEELVQGGSGSAISWESTWQGFMQQLQLGVQYDNDESF